MLERNVTIYLDKLLPVNICGEVNWYKAEITGFEPPFEIEPTKGEHDFNNCEKCQESLKVQSERLRKRYEGKAGKMPFPFCCTYHSNLSKVKEFKKELFDTVPEMVARKIIYTKQHINNNIQSENWYKVITDYIEWAVESFGEMPKNCGARLYIADFFYHVNDCLKENNYPFDKKNRLIEYVTLYTNPKKNKESDFNILLGTFQGWLKVFPFDINSYFGNLKDQLARQIPILSGETITNMYSGNVKSKMHTKSTLIIALLDLTKSLLNKFNGVKLYEKGLISNTNKIKLELIVSSRKLKLDEGYSNGSQNEEQRYRRILKQWFSDEKKFIDEIAPLINSESDIDFIKGQIEVSFTPQGESGFIEIAKKGTIRKFAVEKYFDLELRNWEFEIDNAKTKQEKIVIANNAIFRFRKDWLDWDYQIIQGAKEKVIQHLYACIEYINNSFVEIQKTEIPTQKTVEKVAKPLFNPEFVDTIFDFLKGFFHIEEQLKLHEILKSGDFPKEPLLFLDNGNRLADAFKQLIQSDIIKGCQKKELENWILNSFKYKFRATYKKFTPRYLNDIISTNKDKCQNPVFNVIIEKGSHKISILKA